MKKLKRQSPNSMAKLLMDEQSLSMKPNRWHPARIADLVAEVVVTEAEPEVEEISTEAEAEEETIEVDGIGKRHLFINKTKNSAEAGFFVSSLP
jgi:hypothetical protein